MIRSEVRAQAAANQPGSAKGADGPDGQAAEAVAAESSRPAAALGLPRAPWLVRNPRKATIALVLAVLAAAPFAYLYLQRNFGPDPLGGIKLDGVNIDPFTGLQRATQLPAIPSPGAKPPPTKPLAAVAPVQPAPGKRPPEPFASPAKPAAAAPAAPPLGVTHTRPTVATPVKPEAAPPVAPISGARDKSAAPRGNVREEQTVSGACTEAVAALGFCNPNATEKAK